MKPCLILAIIVGKLVSFFSRTFGFGFGGTWPGHIALKIYPRLISDLESRLPRGSIIITGTNGKTTTAKLITTALEASGFSVLRNLSGANLLNGIASSLIRSSNIVGRIRAEVGIFEVDEAEFPNVLEQIRPETVAILNLFRDQLDRYAELDFIASKWRGTLEKLHPSTKIVLNADDPLVASLGEGLDKSVFYFGLELPHLLKKRSLTTPDSLHCSKCGSLLSYRGFYYSHVGVWECRGCGRKRPKLDALCLDFREFGGLSESKITLKIPSPSCSRDLYGRFSEGRGPFGLAQGGRASQPHKEKKSGTELKTPLVGLFNVYNILAAALVSHLFEIDTEKFPEIWRDFDPAFGRQEEFVVKKRRVKILLSKNPTGFTENLKLVGGGKRALLLVLNDGIADGRDVSWIWDVDFEILKGFKGKIWVSGRRKEDLALRLKYGGIMNYESRIMNLKEAIAGALESISEGETLYILPTYTAMLEVRKILRGRKIL